MLQPLTAPCPSCGCEHGSLVSDRRLIGRSYGTYRCAACRREWTETQETPTPDRYVPEVPEVRSVRRNGLMVVIYRPLRCPHCSGTNVIVTSKPAARERYHLCRDCRQTFRSVEEPRQR